MQKVHSGEKKKKKGLKSTDPDQPLSETGRH